MPFEAPPTAGQESEPVSQPVANLLGTHRHHPRGGQLDGECDAIQTLADLRDSVDSARSVEREIRCGGCGALDEQRHGRRGHPFVDVERRNGPGVLTTDTEGLSGRRDDRHGGRVREDRVDDSCGRIDHVLAIVEHDEESATGQRERQAVDDTHPRQGRDAQRGRNGVGDGRRIRDRGKLDEPHAVGELWRQLCRHLNRQTGLADATHAGQSHQPTLSEECDELGDLSVAPHEARRRAPGGCPARCRPS